MNLTTNFTVEEFTASATADRLRIDNTIPAHLMEQAVSTAQMMERIRTLLSTSMGRAVPIAVSSGYRCPALDLAVRGRPKTGDHSRMLAVDFRADYFGSPYLIAKALAPHISIIGIGQLIYEAPTGTAEWVHVSSRVPQHAVDRVITISPLGPAAGIQPLG